MIELERTFLAKKFPDGFESSDRREMVDIYLPSSSHHPNLRIRKNGEKYEMTKKTPLKEGDSSRQREETIVLTPEEFEELSELEGKRVSKTRYLFPWGERVCEIDVFGGDLRGLVLFDFEFENEEEQEAFTPPEYCLAEVTQETFLAGGMLCGKVYSDIEKELGRFGYPPLYFYE